MNYFNSTFGLSSKRHRTQVGVSNWDIARKGTSAREVAREHARLFMPARWSRHRRRPGFGAEPPTTATRATSTTRATPHSSSNRRMRISGKAKQSGEKGGSGSTRQRQRNSLMCRKPLTRTTQLAHASKKHTAAATLQAAVLLATIEPSSAHSRELISRTCGTPRQLMNPL